MRYFDAVVFPKGSAFCPVDKKARDNLYNSAKAQGELDWYQLQMDSQDKRKTLLEAYHKMCPEIFSEKKRKAVCMLTLKVSVTTETIIDRSRLGEMMWIGHFVSWAAKPKNGAMDIDEARGDFHIRCKNPGALTDNLGPVKAPLRVWVGTKDVIAYTDRFKKAKMSESTEKVMKKATQEDIDKAYAWVQEAHGSEGASFATSALSIEETAGVMMRTTAGGESAWQGQLANLPVSIKDSKTKQSRWLEREPE